jgi:hypothetical protein
MASVTQSTSRLAPRLASGLTLLPPCFLAVLVFTYSVDLPQWDQWTYVSFFEEFSRGSLTLSHLFAQVNEYRQFFPNLVFVALGRLTRWDVRYEMWAILLAACLISFNVYRLGRLTIEGTQLRRALLLFMANLLIFSPVQYPNWLQGQQLVYYVPIACITGCILVAHSRLNPIARFLICGGLSTISTFSSANGGVCWIVVLPVLLTAALDRIPARRWFVAAWIIGLLSNAALYLYGYHKPWWSPSPLAALAHPLQALIYFLIFLGAPLGLEKGKLAMLVGILLLSLFAIGCLFVIRFRDDSIFVRRMTPWLMVGAYSILTGVMTMIGRVGLGVGQSIITARYIGYSVYLVVCLVFVVPIVGEKLTREAKFLSRRRVAQFTVGAAVAFLLWQPLTFAVGIAGMKKMRLELLQAKASVLLINYVQDPELVHTLYPDLSFLAAQANILDKLGYLRPGLERSNRLQDFEGAKAITNGYGSLDHVELRDHVYVVSGIAALPNRHEGADAVLLAYERPNGDCIVFALTHPKLGTAGSHDPGDDGRHLQRWELSLSADRLPARPANITAWAFDANSARAYRLDGSYVIP